MRRPDAGEEGQRPFFAEREPDVLARALAVLIGFGEGREGDQAAVGRPQPRRPVGVGLAGRHAGRVADIGRALVRLHLQHLGEVELRPFGPKLVGAAGRGLEQRLLGRRHAPTHVAHFAAVGSADDHRRRIIGIDSRHRRLVVVAVDQRAAQGRGLRSSPHHCVEVAHAGQPNRRRGKLASARRVLGLGGLQVRRRPTWPPRNRGLVATLRHDVVEIVGVVGVQFDAEPRRLRTLDLVFEHKGAGDLNADHRVR